LYTLLVLRVAKDKALRSFETSEIVYYSTWPNIPEDFNIILNFSGLTEVNHISVMDDNLYAV